ncbi:hypothetical protein [Micromonospora sp. NPDC004704]
MDDVAAAVRHGLQWLERHQRNDGHWAGESPLSEVHATTRSLRAFIGAGFPENYPAVARAARWLVRPEAEGSVYHYFWRLGALTELAGTPREVIEHDLDVVCQTIGNRIRLDEKLNYHAFLFDCAANCGMGGRFPDQAVELLAMLRDPRLHATPALWGFVALERSGLPTDGLEGRISELVLSALNDQNGYNHMNGLVAETSFFVFNVCRSTLLSNDPKMRSAVSGAVRWIISRQLKREGAWPIEPPLYNADPQCDAYFTGIATRALLEYLRRYAPQRQGEVFVPDWRLRRILGVALRWFVGITLGLSLALLGAFVIPGYWGLTLAILGAVAAVIEIGNFALGLRRLIIKK